MYNQSETEVNIILPSLKFVSLSHYSQILTVKEFKRICKSYCKQADVQFIVNAIETYVLLQSIIRRLVNQLAINEENQLYNEKATLLNFIILYNAYNLAFCVAHTIYLVFCVAHTERSVLATYTKQNYIYRKLMKIISNRNIQVLTRMLEE